VTDLQAVSGALVVIAACCLGGLWWVTPRQERTAGAAVSDALASVASAVAGLRPVAPRRETTTVSVMNASETVEYLRVTMEARRRGPSLTVRTPDGRLSVCVCSGRGADGVWVYRRVGVERET
jgi:hypothetical protein